VVIEGVRECITGSVRVCKEGNTVRCNTVQFAVSICGTKQRVAGESGISDVEFPQLALGSYRRKYRGIDLNLVKKLAKEKFRLKFRRVNSGFR